MRGSQSRTCSPAVLGGGMLERMLGRLRNVGAAGLRSRLQLSCLACLVILAAGACDPGVSYEPVGWRDRGDDGWQSGQDGMTLRMIGGAGGLIGNKWLPLELEVENHSAGWVVFESASLTTLGRTYTEACTAHPLVPLQWTVPPGIKKEIWFSFNLDQAIDRAVGPTADVGLFYRRDIGPLRRLSIRLRKERSWSWLG